MLPRPSIMGERNPSIDHPNDPRTSAAPVNPLKSADLFSDFAGPSTLPPLRSSSSMTTTVCAASSSVARRVSSDVNTVGPGSSLVVHSANIRGASLSDDGGNGSSFNRNSGAFSSSGTATLLAPKTARQTLPPRAERPPRASCSAYPAAMTVAMVTRQCSSEVGAAATAGAAPEATASVITESERNLHTSDTEDTSQSATQPSCTSSRRTLLGSANRPQEETPSHAATVATPPPPPLRSEVGMFQLEYVDRDGAVQQRLSAFVNYCGNGPSMVMQDPETVFAAQLGPFLREPRQFREMVVEMLEKSAAAAATTDATQDGAEDAAPGDTIEAAGGKNDSGETAPAAVAAVPLDPAAMSKTVVNALRSEAAASATSASDPPTEPMYQPLPRFTFKQALRKAKELWEPNTRPRGSFTCFSGGQPDAATTAGKPNATEEAVRGEHLATPHPAPAMLLTPIMTPQAPRMTRGVSADPTARRLIPYINALPTFQTDVQAAAKVDRINDLGAPLTPLQTQVYDLCGAEMAARRTLWTAFLADRYELSVVAMGFLSTYERINAPLDHKLRFDVVLSFLSTMVQSYLNSSLEESLVWIVDAYLAVYKPRPVLNQVTTTPSPPSTGSPPMHPLHCTPSPIAARAFRSVVTPQSSNTVLAPPTDTPLSTITTSQHAAAPMPVLGAGKRPPLRVGVKDPLPTFRSFVKRHPRGLPGVGAASRAPVFTASFLLCVSLKALDEFATLPHMTVPSVVASAVQMLLPSAARSTSIFSDSLGSGAGALQEMAFLASGSTKTEACVALGRSGGQVAEGSITMSSTEVVPPHRCVEPQQTAFWRLLRRWNSTPTPQGPTTLMPAVGVAARPSSVTPYAAALVALRQIFRFYHSEAASIAASDSPVSLRHFYPLPGVTFERVAAMVRTVMLSNEFFASVEAAAASHFGFHTRLSHYRSITGGASAVGPQHLDRILQQCAQEAINLSAAIHEVWWQARVWWLSYVQSAFRSTSPVRQTAPCILSGVNITGLNLSGLRALGVDPRRLSNNASALPPGTAPQRQHQRQNQRQRSPCQSSCVRQWPAPAEDGPLPPPPFVTIITSPLSSPLESLAALTAHTSVESTGASAAPAPAAAAGGDQAANGRSPLVARSAMHSMAPSYFGHEVSSGSSCSVTTSENLSTPLAISSELPEPVGEKVAVFVPRPPALRFANSMSRGPATLCNPNATVTSPPSTHSRSHDSARLSHETDDSDPQSRRSTDAFLTTVPLIPLVTTRPDDTTSTLPCLNGAPPRASALAVPPLKSLLSSRFTGTTAEWDLAVLLRREAYERAAVVAQQACEARLLQVLASDNARAVQTAWHVDCVVTRMHSVRLDHRRRDPARSCWDQVCMEKQMFVNRWVKQRADMQLEFFAVAVHQSQAELQVEGMACLADEFQTLAQVAWRRRHARRPTQSPRRTSDQSVSALPPSIVESNRLAAELPPSSMQRQSVVSMLLPSAPGTAGCLLPVVLPVSSSKLAAAAPVAEPRPFQLWGYGDSLPPADSPMGLRDGVLIMTRLCRDLQLGGRSHCTQWFRTDDSDVPVQRVRGDFQELRYANRDVYVGYTRARLPAEAEGCRADASEDAPSVNRRRSSAVAMQVADQPGAGDLLRHGPGLYTATAAGYTYVGGWRNDRPHGDGALLFNGALPRGTGAAVLRPSMTLVFGQWQNGQLMHVELQYSGEASAQ